MMSGPPYDILVFGPARAGNQLLCSILHATGCASQYTHFTDFSFDNSEPAKAKILLRLYRRNAFQHCLSLAVCSQEGITAGENFLDSQGKLLTKYHNFRIDPQHFINAFFHNVSFHTQVYYQHRWEKTFTICYEDYCNNPDFVFDLIGLPQLTEIKPPMKTPCSYREHVSNWHELYNLFPQLVQDVQRRYFDTSLPRYYPIDDFYVEDILPDALKLTKFNCDSS